MNATNIIFSIARKIHLYTISAIQSIQFLVPATLSNSIDQSIYGCQNAHADGGNEFIRFRFYIAIIIL